MNILIIGLNNDGAMGDNLTETTKELIKNNKYNWYLMVEQTNRYKFEDIGLNGKISVKYKKSEFVSLFKELIRVSKYIKDNNINIILFLTPNFIFNIFISIYFFKIKKVYYLHDPIPHTGESILRRIILNIQNFIVSQMSSRVIVACEYVKKLILKKNILNLKNKKIENIYLGELSNLEFENVKNNIVNEDIDILFFGRIEQYKGIDTLLKALIILENEGISLKTKIVGKGDISKYVLDDSKHLFNIKNEYVEDKELAYYIKRSKIVVFPYKSATGSQTVQACYYYSKPIIASKVGCFNDYIINNVTGILFDPCDEKQLVNCIKKLINNKKLCSELGEGGNQLLKQKFNMKKIANSYYILFDEIMEGECK
jgi:glycosyltransferase involved in cell wall biosynthesis